MQFVLVARDKGSGAVGYSAGIVAHGKLSRVSAAMKNDEI